MNLYQSVKAIVAEIVVEFKNSKEDGFTVQEVMALIHMIISSLMTAAQSMFDNETGNFKKTAVLEALGYAYDDYLDDLIQKASGVPKYLFPIFNKIAKQFILWIAEWAIDGIYEDKVQAVGYALSNPDDNPFFSELEEEDQLEMMVVSEAAEAVEASESEPETVATEAKPEPEAAEAPEAVETKPETKPKGKAKKSTK